MASESAAGAIKHEADVRILEVLETLGEPDLVENLRALGSGSPTRDPWLAAAASARMMAGLAIILAAQDQRIAALEAKPASGAAKKKPAARKKEA